MYKHVNLPSLLQRQSSLLVSSYLPPLMVAMFLPLLLVACGGSGEGLDANGRPLYEQSGESNTSGDAFTSGDFNQLQDDVFNVSCATSGCHSGTSAPLGLNLDAGKAYDKLVGQPSLQINGLQLVEPNNPDASYLVHKLEGTQGGGVQMPLGKPPVSASQLALIRQWIANGALSPISSPTDDSDKSGSGTNTSDNSSPDETDNATNETAGALQPRLNDIQTRVFDIKCTACHTGTAPSAALNLTQGQSYSQLVERAARIDPLGMPLVSIGDPGNSFLVDKLRGRALGTSGAADYRGIRMPVVGGYLTDTEVQAIEQWISDGANEDSR